MVLAARVAMVGLIIGILAMAGCSGDEVACSPIGGVADGDGCCPPATAGGQLPPQLFISEAPADAQDLAAVLATATDGQVVTVRGRIGGQKDPFIETRAVMMLVDTALPTCDSKDDDHCPTPWDYCCEPKDVIARHAVSVQVDDAEGRPLRASLRGAGGLAPLKNVIVQGTVRQDSAGSRSISATSIYVGQ